MLRINTHIQLSFLDLFEFLGPKRKDMLESGWAYLFREFLYTELPVEAIQSAFHTSLGRPTKELHTMPGVLLLQQMFDLTDQETVRRFPCEIPPRSFYNHSVNSASLPIKTDRLSRRSDKEILASFSNTTFYRGVIGKDCHCEHPHRTSSGDLIKRHGFYPPY